MTLLHDKFKVGDKVRMIDSKRNLTYKALANGTIGTIIEIRGDVKNYVGELHQYAHIEWESFLDVDEKELSQDWYYVVGVLELVQDVQKQAPVKRMMPCGWGKVSNDYLTEHWKG